MFDSINIGNMGIFGLAKDSDTRIFQAGFYVDVNGKTSNEIIDFAKKKEKIKATKQLISTKEKIATLEAKKKKYQERAAILKKIEVSNARYYWSEAEP